MYGTETITVLLSFVPGGSRWEKSDHRGKPEHDRCMVTFAECTIATVNRPLATNIKINGRNTIKIERPHCWHVVHLFLEGLESKFITMANIGEYKTSIRRYVYGDK